MKRILTLGIILCMALSSFAQVDTTGKENPSEKSDTIKVGGMIIIRKPGGEHDIYKNEKGTTYHYHSHDYNRPANISTNWCIFDFGFSLYTDKTDYKSPETQAFAPGTNKDAFRLNTWKSRNINLWLFMQKLNVVQHVVNLKYGFGLELNNYYYTDNRLHYEKNQSYVVRLDSAFAILDKNKLAVDYLTVPLMVNFNFTPDRGRGFGVSAGVSAGLRYSSRQKIKNNGDVHKLHDDFTLRTWKISYIGEILLGPVKFYGSYATQSMWEKGLDQTPYTVGIRLSNW